MIFSNDRDKLRQTFFDVWLKIQNKQPLDPLEIIISDTILMHPEYHSVLSKKDSLKQDFTPEQGQENPFLHMSMHIAIKEQVQAKRPTGIDKFYKKSAKRTKDLHKTEHIVMDCLAQSLWQAQRNNTMPDENAYIECIRKHS